jgi:hypothetical protein
MRTEQVHVLTSNVAGTLANGARLALDLESLVLDPAAFARIGSPVATTAAAAHREMVRSLGALLSLLSQLNTAVARAADTYTAMDRGAAGAYGTVERSV